MNNIAFILFIFDLLALLFVGPMYFRALGKLLDYIKTEKIEIWDELGRPSLVTNNSISSSISTIKYLVKKSYMSSHDTNLINLADRARQLFYLSTIMAVFLFVFINLSMITR